MTDTYMTLTAVSNLENPSLGVKAQPLAAGIKQARILRGVVVQARSAFVFTAEELLRFSALLAVITSYIDLCN